MDCICRQQKMTKQNQKNRQLDNPLSHLSLGKQVEYICHYAPELLQAVPRSLSREQIGLTDNLPFSGFDIWNGYELSWLNLKGKPQIALLQCSVPCQSPNLIESKSFKLYLNSFNQQPLDSIDTLKKMLIQDLSGCAGKPVDVRLFTATEFNQLQISDLAGECIDDLDIEIHDYDLNPAFLTHESEHVEETLTSNLLKSNCLITNQPDWGSVSIHYHGKKICQEGLLRYIISFRQHNEFHEQCVERIFNDIMQHCKPQKLSVYARYTRRGGLDINPFRSNFEQKCSMERQARQ